MGGGSRGRSNPRRKQPVIWEPVVPRPPARPGGDGGGVDEPPRGEICWLQNLRVGVFHRASVGQSLRLAPTRADLLTAFIDPKTPLGDLSTECRAAFNRAGALVARIEQIEKPGPGSPPRIGIVPAW